MHFPCFSSHGHQAQKSHRLAGWAKINAQRRAAANHSNESNFQGPTKAQIHTAIPAPGISLSCQPVPVRFCSPLVDKFFDIPLSCTDMFIRHLIQPSMCFSKYFQCIKLDSGKCGHGSALPLGRQQRELQEEKYQSLCLCADLAQVSKVSQNPGPFARHRLWSPGNFVKTPATGHYSVILVSQVLASLFWWLCHSFVWHSQALMSLNSKYEEKACIIYMDNIKKN